MATGKLRGGEGSYGKPLVMPMIVVLVRALPGRMLLCDRRPASFSRRNGFPQRASETALAHVHVFRGQERVFGFTLDQHGANLPARYSPWTAFKTIELHDDQPYRGVALGACLDDISEHGFHLTAAHQRITHLAVT